MRLASILGLALCGIATCGAASASCERYGQGFVALGGTDTCVRIGGRVRADYLSAPFKGASDSAPVASGSSAWRRAQGAATEGDIELDARSPTALGTVRTYVRVRGVNDPNGIYQPNR